MRDPRTIYNPDQEAFNEFMTSGETFMCPIDPQEALNCEACQ